MALVCLLVALAGVDLVHHAAADASSHGAGAVCVAVLEGFALAASVLVAAVVALPRERLAYIAAPPAYVPPEPPVPAAREGPADSLVLRL